jgi:hypothetical protein
MFVQGMLGNSNRLVLTSLSLSGKKHRENDHPKLYFLTANSIGIDVYY